MIIEGTVLTKETGLRASFEGVEQPYVRCTIARLDQPDVHAQARIIGLDELPVPIGGQVRLEVVRAITDRKAGVVRYDCELLS